MQMLKKGFTLIEMLLVLVIMAVILLAIASYTQQRTDALRRDRTVMQIQQIENAALAYYISQSTWPTNIAQLQLAGFLPRQTTINNPYGNSYFMNANNTTGTFAVCTEVLAGNPNTATATAQTIAGRLPMGFIVDTTPTDANCLPSQTPRTTCADNNCTVVSVINIPGQNLNNARAVNFAGVYHHGGCVPVPACPGTNMTPAILAIPVSVSGMYSNTTTIYPISSFTAYATAPGNLNTPGPSQCTNSAVPEACDLGSGGIASPTGMYWRVCLQIYTEKGLITASTNSIWASETGIVALTRCVPQNEPFGSSFSVWSPN